MSASEALARERSFAVGAVETTGVAVAPMPDGTIAASVQRLEIRNITLGTRSGAVDIAALVVDRLVVRLAVSQPGTPPQLVEASAEQVRVGNLDGFVDELPSAAAAGGGSLELEALAGLEGIVRAYVTDALWIIDAEIVVPIAAGTIDFNRVVVEHVGPNSTLNVGPTSIYISAPSRRRIDMFSFGAQGVPGASFDSATRSRLRRGDHGRLALAPFLQALLAAPRDAPLTRVADPGLERALRETRVSGEVKLGDGALGTARHRIVLTDRAGGRNRVEISSAALGERILVRVPAFAASDGTFALGARTLTAAALDAAIDLHVVSKKRESAGDARSLAVAVRDATLRGVRLA